MHDLTTIQRMNREASLAAITESVTEADEVTERAEAMQRHPAGKRAATQRTAGPSRTPEEVAATILADIRQRGIREFVGKLDGSTPVTPFEAYAKIAVAAIEADRANRPPSRAQRAADLATLADAASSWATELTDNLIPKAYVKEEGVARYTIERDAIQAALGRYLDEVDRASRGAL